MYDDFTMMLMNAIVSRQECPVPTPGTHVRDRINRSIYGFLKKMQKKFLSDGETLDERRAFLIAVLEKSLAIAKGDITIEQFFAENA